MKNSTYANSKRVIISLLVSILLPLASIYAQQYTSTNPPPATPPSNVSNVQDRDQMVYQLGIRFNANPSKLQDPNRPSNAYPSSSSSPEGNWTDAAGHTITTSGFGLWNNYNDSLVGVYTPIDLLKMKDGTIIKTADQWKNQRRPEILKDVTEQMWGVIPADSILPKITWSVVTTKGGSGGAAYIQKVITGTIDVSRFPTVRNKPKIVATLRTPAIATGKVPVMVVLSTSIDTYWGYAQPQGWGACAFDYGQLQPDNGAGLTSYIIGLCNKGNWRKPSDWGALAAWGWGVSKLVDYFQTDPNVDATKIGVSGHSRWGKGTLVAMAYDPRIFIAYPSCGGSMGTKMNRYHWGQDLENSSWDQEYHWMAGNFFKWMGEKYPGRYLPRKIEDCPVDAHSLISLCAPRPIFINAGKQDSWNSMYGIYMACAAASPAYEILGKKGVIMPDSLPIVDTAYIAGDIAHRFHKEGHTDTPDWPAFWRFAAKYVTSPALTLSVSSLSLADSLNSKATFTISSISSWTIQKPSWLDISSTSGSGNKSITITANAINSLDSARIDTISVSVSGLLPIKLTVLQPSKTAAPWLSATPNDTVKVAGIANTFPVNVSSNASWTIAVPSWITTSSASGANKKNVTFSVTASTDSVNSRVGKILITVKGAPNDSLYVKQSPGIIIPSYVNLWSSAYAQNIANVDIGAAASTTNYFQVNSDVNVGRSCSSSDSWLTASILAPSNTYGSWWYRVNLTAQANNTGVARIATVTVQLSRYTAKTLTITQAAGGGGSTSAGSITLSKTSLNVTSNSASTGTFTVTSDTTWTITSSSPWITPSPASGSKNGTITLTTTEANPADSIRTSTITATIPSGSTKTLAASQLASTSALDISITSLNVQSMANTFNFNITSDTAWIIKSSSWMGINLPTGINNRKIIMFVGANITTKPRRGTITVVAGLLKKTITVTQDSIAPTLYVLPSSLRINGSGDYIPTLAVSSNAKYAITTSSNWLTATPSWMAATPTIVKLKAGQNNNAFRTAFVTVTVTGLPSQTFKILQDVASPALSTSLSNINIPGEGVGIANFDIACNTFWNITSSNSWVKVYPDSGIYYGLATFSVDRNASVNPRNATITITALGLAPQTITLTQAAGSGLSVGNLSSDDVDVYPNPVKGILYIKSLSSPTRIKLSNMSGEELLLKNIEGSSTEINMADYPSGIYFLKLSYAGKTIVKKVVKQ